MPSAAIIGAFLVGAMVGVVALLYFIRLVRGIAEGSASLKASFTNCGVLIGVLLGTNLARAPIGIYVLTDDFWSWYAIGEAVGFLPPALAIVWRYAVSSFKRVR